MSVSEHAVFACEFAGGGGDKRRSGGRKSSVSVWISASDLLHLLDGTVCHACTQADNIIFVMSHAQIYIKQRFKSNARETWCVILVSES